ncbi:MAG: aldo/keto reductase [Candidatus Syntrophonatronum acetioxidans]|uniref:Aldo/keto reductase n=1 Tax=Candidatus Syntrophonatronum acetioxidans TaxID=1795816 RepID=A0A424YHP2_9FIRM|nr:MAG: aldo/keto reductase [Candidatus Syntrophonatronum acetioxidans]
MEYRYLGRTGIKVSRLCFGTLTIGPLQASLSVKKGASIIREAWKRGINFFDTAETYRNYEHIREAFKDVASPPVIATKSYAYQARDMEKHLSRALKTMGLEAVDIFLLHEQESELTIKGHYNALNYLLKAKEKGYVKAVGISTHTVAGVRDALKYPEIEVIHPMVNIKGIGIKDGTLPEMLKALKRAGEKGLGLYAMKPLGGGHLINSFEEALRFVISLDFLDSIALGLQSLEELEANEAIFKGEEIGGDLAEKLRNKARKLVIGDWCEGCGECVRHCPQGALFLSGGKVKLRVEDCTFCGYCGPYCQDMCLKIY